MLKNSHLQLLLQWPNKVQLDGGGQAPTTLKQGVANMAIHTANFLSYNPTGISTEKCDFINKICDENYVMFVSFQEHFKNNKTVDKYFSKNFKSFSSYDIPGFRPNNQEA